MRNRSFRRSVQAAVFVFRGVVPPIPEFSDSGQGLGRHENHFVKLDTPVFVFMLPPLSRYKPRLWGTTGPKNRLLSVSLAELLFGKRPGEWFLPQEPKHFDMFYIQRIPVEGEDIVLSDLEDGGNRRCFHSP